MDDILDLYQHFSDLVIEMIQGTKEENFDNIYIRLSEKYQLFNELGEINYSTLSSFIFLQHCIEMEKILSEKDNIFDKEILPIILNMFTIIVNIISQEVKDTAIIQNLIIIFPPEKVIGIIGNYLKRKTLRLRKSNIFGHMILNLKRNGQLRQLRCRLYREFIS